MFGEVKICAALIAALLKFPLAIKVSSGVEESGWIDATLKGGGTSISVNG